MNARTLPCDKIRASSILLAGYDHGNHAIVQRPSNRWPKCCTTSGDISPERIRLPVGTATEEDVIEPWTADDKRLYELIDGVLVEKVMGMRGIDASRR